MAGFLTSGFFRRRVLNPAISLLRQGMTPHKLSVTLVIGTLIGILPVFGATTLLGTALAARFRLNIAATVMVSYLVHPLQLLLFIPFIKLGVFLFRLEALRFSLEEMVALFRYDWLEALNKLWLANLAAIAAWAVVALPAGLLLHILLLPILKRVMPAPVPVAVPVPSQVSVAEEVSEV